MCLMGRYDGNGTCAHVLIHANKIVIQKERFLICAHNIEYYSIL